MKLTGLRALSVIDSNANNALLIEALSGDFKARAIAPSGTSAGSHEMKIIPHDKALRRVNELSSKLMSKSLDSIDSLINNEAGNVSTGISMAINRLIAKIDGKELFDHFNGSKLPIPCFNIINGGLHAGNNLSFQEFMIIPQEKTFRESLMTGVKVYKELKDVLIRKFGRIAVNAGMEGGFAPPLSNVSEALSIITGVINDLGLSKKVKLGLDVAANELLKGKNYLINGLSMSKNELIDYYESLVNDFPIISIEDPFFEDDFKSFSELRKRLGNVMIVGDDLLTTNASRVSKAVSNDSCDCLLVKLNQAGTVKKTIDAIIKARSAGWKLMVSHRSGDSCDSFIADFAVGVNAEFIKSGAPSRGERVSKYNRLLEIEELLKLKNI